MQPTTCSGRSALTAARNRAPADAGTMPRPYNKPRASADGPAAERRAPGLHAEVVLLDELVLSELLRASPLELDAAVDDDVAAVGDLGRLVEVLLGHQHRQLVTLLELADLGDHAADEDGCQPHRGLV